MKFEGLDDLYETAVTCYAAYWPEPLDPYDAFKDGKRERFFGMLEGIADAIDVCTNGAITAESRLASYNKIKQDIEIVRALTSKEQIDWVKALSEGGEWLA